MKCPQWQFENPERARFCNECGGQLAIARPNCEKDNPSGRKFCNGCRHDLIKSKENPRIAYAKPESYTPKYLAEKILTSRSALEGQRKQVTVLFSDMEGFISFGEKTLPGKSIRTDGLDL